MTERARPRVEILPTLDEVWKAAAERIVAASGEAVRRRGRFTLALSGGETPRGLYELLASPPYLYRIDWRLTHFFWSDERCVTPDDRESNFRMAREAMLDPARVAQENIHRIRGEDEPLNAANAYERELREFFSASFSPEAVSLDLVLLGLGEEGHTASLFPGGTAVTESSRWAVAERIAKLGRWRVTMTPVCINAAAEVVFLAAGRGKSEILRRVVQDPPRPLLFPAQAISPRSGWLTWVVDAEAAAEIRGSGGG